MTEVPSGSKGVAFTNWLVSKASGVLERKSSRRGFLIGSAMAGSAVAVAGCAPATQPGSSYNHITDCAGGLCTDGYTEFCCTINNGLNACPPDSFAGGWWRADFSTFCNGTRYYIDCMQFCCGPDLGNGFCAGCAECRCGGGCDTRRVYCNYFRYGQCHQEIGITGPIACRVVTCTPPYLDASMACSTALAVDNSTAEHAPAHDCTPPPPPAPVFIAVLPSTGALVSTTPNHLGLFARRPNGAVALHEFDGQGWSETAMPSAITTSGIGATSDGSATYAFIRGTDGGYWWARRPNGGSWGSSWSYLGGGFRSDPAMAADGNGVYAFGRGNNDGLWWMHWNGSSFVGMSALDGGVQSDPCAVNDGNGAWVFARGVDGAIWYRRMYGGSPGPWTSLGGVITCDPAACATSDGPLVVGRGTGNDIWVRYVLGQYGVTGWQPLGGQATSDPAICTGPAGTFIVVRGSDSALWFSKWGGGTTWSSWARIGANAVSSPVAVSDASGAMVAFVGSDNALRAFRYTNGSWGPERFIQGGYAPVRGGL